ncbi:MAG: DUF1801 domain-containing protein [Nanoarchaeota archaeon]|nr:DUF1801 domain-containing protein [Nanoarchaeota archaeon]
MAYEIKTKKSQKDVIEFIEEIDTSYKEDFKDLFNVIKEVTKETPSIFGENIIGFGLYSYESKAKCSGEWFHIGISPRKAGISLYTMCYQNDKVNSLKEQLDGVKLGKACITIRKYEKVDKEVLKELIKEAYKDSKKIYES